MSADFKASLRKIARANLKANLPEQNGKSSLIWNVLVELDAFKKARKNSSILIYNDFQEEVKTTRYFPSFLEIPETKTVSASKQYRETMNRLFGNDLPESDIFRTLPSIFVPYCENEEIVPLRIYSLDELETGFYDIKEPRKSLRSEAGRHIDPVQLELIVAPGLGFDQKGNRLGRGKGYYDRLLARTTSRTFVVGLAFECQIFETIPVSESDQPVDMVITESRIIEAARSRR